jgi:conjugative relaxase-like TrwC/TraI family protein
VLRIVTRRHVDPGYYRGQRAEFEHLGLDGGLRVVGRMAPTLGLPPALDERTASALLRGNLGGPRDLAGPRRAVQAIELIFAPDKAVSIMAMCGPPELAETVVAAHERAVGAALSYLEDRAVAPQGRIDHTELSRAWLGFAATHGVSRAGDPHLHSHVLVMNLVRSVEGRFRPIDARGLFAHHRAAGALYDAELSGALVRELGFSATTVPTLAVAALSTRSAALRQDGLEARFVPPRPATRRELVDLWERRLTAVGLSTAAVVEYVRVSQRLPTRLDERAFAVELGGGASPVTRRDVVAAWARASGGASSASTLGCVDGLIGTASGGVFEVPLAPRALFPRAATLDRLGPRPVEPRALGRWLERDQRMWSRDEDDRSRSRSPRRLRHGMER